MTTERKPRLDISSLVHVHLPYDESMGFADLGKAIGVSAGATFAWVKAGNVEGVEAFVNEDGVWSARWIKQEEAEPSFQWGRLWPWLVASMGVWLAIILVATWIGRNWL